MSDLMVEGPDEQGWVSVEIPPWIFLFREGKKTPIAIWRTDKSRIFQEDDLEPPSYLVHKAQLVAKIQFIVFGKRG